MKMICLTFFLVFTTQVMGQQNCEAYLYQNDTLKYRACRTAEKRKGHYQFSRRYQEALDKSLAIDSSFAFAYRAKSTAYLKSGDFVTWKKLMDLAVAHDPTAYLDYRGWCRYQFFRDYQGAIDDIEYLDQLVDYDIGYSVNGDYHLHIARALCYKALGDKQKAITIIENHMKNNTQYAGPYDYLHLGVLYLETGQYPSALKAFKEQENTNDLAENRYYISLIYSNLGKESAVKNQLVKAKELYLEGYRMFDPYVAIMDQIYLDDIDAMLND